MPMPTVGEALITCWNAAEDALREQVSSNYYDRDEPFLTEMFSCLLARRCESASAAGDFERALLTDLYQAGLTVPTYAYGEIASGLIAEVSFHAPKVEGKTGGDFGIVVCRPEIQHGYGPSELTLNNDSYRGLLVQAKVLQRDGHWGRFSRKQHKVLPDKLGYASLLLYQYQDNTGNRRELAPLQWHLMSEAKTLKEVKQWLTKNAFRTRRTSQEILGSLLDDTIGTDDENVIRHVITPPQRESLSIKICWRNGPPDIAHLTEQVVQHVHQLIINS